MAAVSGYAYVPTDVDIAFYNWIDATAEMNHRPGKVRPKPVKRPWEQKKRAVAAPAIPDADSARRREALKERFGLRM